ncbi:SDR family oxidoreductase [Methylomagnum ishizawai]|uniref:SDR family oxidoreductase n=1 Tax=Methylomagnum ishizawai TaxID=1760988 RepID=UPI001C8038C3|nr:SDR family oxidoreductase [Methylomagnum ishizawai]
MTATEPHRPPIFIVGCGDIGQRVARLELAAGNLVAALARSEASARTLAALGIRPIQGDLDHPATLTQLPAALATLYYFAPPPPTGGDDPRLRALLAALPAPPERVVYISTSGVYGDCQGAWIDEDAPLQPRTDRARRRLAAESALLAWSGRQGVPCVILRVPGIYGPGRLPVERIRQGIPVVHPAEAPYSNRIHADDLAAGCCAAARKGRPGTAYHLSDGHPTTMTDYFQRVADALGLPRPPLVGLAEARRTFSPAMLSFLEESKRLDNRRMLEELGVVLRYPDLASGLPACLGEE